MNRSLKWSRLQDKNEHLTMCEDPGITTIKRVITASQL